MSQRRTVPLEDALALIARDHRAGKRDQARQRSAELARRFPHRADCWLTVCRCGMPDQRRTIHQGARRALTIAPDTLDAYLAMCHLFQEADPVLAERLVRWAIMVAPQSDRAHLAAALVANRITASGSTVRQARRPPALAPDQARGWTILGDSHLGDGDADAAEVAFRRALLIEPSSPGGLYSLSTAAARPLPADLVARTVAAADGGMLSKADQEFAGFALGSHFDRAGDTAAAFRWFSLANAIHREGSAPDLAMLHRFLALSKAVSWPPLPSRIPVAENDGHTPIFIVGLPGSGTTMVESALSMHSAVTPAGELGLINAIAGGVTGYPDAIAGMPSERCTELANGYLKSLVSSVRPSTSHVTDKMPTNFFHLGLIRTLFPRSPIIHTSRDPMAAAWSIFRRRFTLGHDYAYDLDDIAEFIDVEQHLMAHWKALWPGAIHTVPFEALLDDPASAIRALIDHVGLPWEAECLNFHRARRRVSTASALAVRQPADRRSSGQWRRYAEYLEPVRRRLGLTG